jgi:16S rRNA processing protein RimM
MTPRKTMSKANSGSPPSGEPEYLLVGKLRRPHGLRGDLVMEIVTDFPERLKPGTPVFIGEQHHSGKILDTRQHAHGLLIRFEGVDTPEKAGLLRNEGVYVSAANRPSLPEGTFYHHELLGLKVIDDQDVLLGHLNEILLTGANDVYVVQTPEGKELLLPVIDSVVLGIDVVARTIRVRVPSGLITEPPRSNPRRSTTGKKSNARNG